ncbi:hypothetical protein KAR91_38705 [Candidatus Pacearchaeota archaeon]|nr:hypothetical protein [Candidatus Pacearchaeota archaeon]
MSDTVHASNNRVCRGVKWFCRNMQGYRGGHVLDYGAGRSLKSKRYMTSYGIYCHRFDPYNVPMEENERSIELSNWGRFNAIVCNGVLNVLDDMELAQVVGDLKKHARLNTAPIYITVYRGNGSGIGARGINGEYQRNMQTADYMPMLRKHFDVVAKIGKTIILHKF